VTLIGFVSGRSPGLTTAVHALAVAWPPGRRALIAELDPAGGSLAARHAIAPDPGLVSLAAAGRRGVTPEQVMEHCQQLADRTPVVVGPASPERATSALVTLGGQLGRALGALSDVDVLADCGRLDGRSPALEVVEACHCLILVVEPTVEGVAHLASRLPALRLPAGRHALVSIGDRPYRAGEVARALDLPLLGVMAWDPKGALALAEGRPKRRGRLLRSAVGLAATLVGQLPTAEQEMAQAPTARPGRPSSAVTVSAERYHDGGDAPPPAWR
jgi:hypothetical protein